MSFPDKAYKILLIIALIFFGYLTFAQEPDEIILPLDSNVFFTEYPKMLAVQLYTQTKTNTLDITTNDQALKLRPNGMTNLGLNASLYGISLGFSYGLPKTGGKVEKYGETKRFDIQLSAYSSRFGFDGFLQGYKGYYNANPKDFVDWNKNYFPLLPDLDVYSAGVSAFYIFNYKKYSYKAAYKRTAVQHKSAGSFVLGGYGYYDDVKSDNGFIPAEFPDSLKTEFDLKKFTNYSVGISFGYMHTFVLWKDVILNLSMLPGAGWQETELTTLNDKKGTSNVFAGQVKWSAALGYEHKFFYLGITSSTILRSLGYRDFDVDLSTGQFRFFIGKRFNL